MALQHVFGGDDVERRGDGNEAKYPRLVPQGTVIEVFRDEDATTPVTQFLVFDTNTDETGELVTELRVDEESQVPKFGIPSDDILTVWVRVLDGDIFPIHSDDKFFARDGEDFAPVAFSGDYNDLHDKPELDSTLAPELHYSNSVPDPDETSVPYLRFTFDIDGDVQSIILGTET